MQSISQEHRTPPKGVGSIHKQKQILLFIALYAIFVSVMGKKQTTVPPSARKALAAMGENIRLARLRRKLSMALVAERAGISVPTLRAIEQGSPSVAIGSYATVLLAIGMKDELSHVAANDELGRYLQDQDLEPKKRAPPLGKVHVRTRGGKRMSGRSLRVSMDAIPYLSLDRSSKPTHVGTLHFSPARNGEAVSFEFSSTWLAVNPLTSFDPDLQPWKGRQYLEAGKPLVRRVLRLVPRPMGAHASSAQRERTSDAEGRSAERCSSQTSSSACPTAREWVRFDTKNRETAPFLPKIQPTTCRRSRRCESSNTQRAASKLLPRMNGAIPFISTCCCRRDRRLAARVLKQACGIKRATSGSRNSPHGMTLSIPALWSFSLMTLRDRSESTSPTHRKVDSAATAPHSSASGSSA